jgi:uncharacterized protein (UPF0548 family)
VNIRIQKRLAELADKPVNFDPVALDLANPPEGWNVDDRRQPLPSEPPGEPVHEGSWETGRGLIRGYEFADPSMVRAFYDPGKPLAERDMLLELRTLAIVHVYVGVRVGDVYNEVREVNGRQARVFGWYYRTLEGHVEEGQMDWQVWKWLDSGEVEFRVYAVSRTAPIANPLVRVGFWLLRDHERSVFLNSTNRRMRSFTELALRKELPAERVREAAPGLTARRRPADDTSHEELARHLEDN